MTGKQFLESIKENYDQDGFEIAHNFFVVFSRFEFALKASRNYLKNGNGNKAEANWDLFTSDIRVHFNKKKNTELSDAVNYILAHPPRIQKYIDGQIAWQNRIFNNQPEINRLSQSIRDIRNNLFHGGKFTGRYEQDASRNVKLLKSAMIILDEWLLLSEPVKRAFLSSL